MLLHVTPTQLHPAFVLDGDHGWCHRPQKTATGTELKRAELKLIDIWQQKKVEPLPSTVSLDSHP